MRKRASTPKQNTEPIETPQGEAAASQPQIRPQEVVMRRPRLAKLIIRNFRCIGSHPVVVDLDDIVVLVGPNNTGKSSILKAYQVVMSEGSDDGNLSLSDFPGNIIKEDALPEIELHTIVYDNSPGEKWIETTAEGEKLVRELWRWLAPGPPIRRGFLVRENRWAGESDTQKVPWGAAGVANARRPQPHRVDAFASPDSQTKEIIKIIMQEIKDRLKNHTAATEDSPFKKLLAGIGELQRQIISESTDHIEAVQSKLSEFVSSVFPNHHVVFDARPEDDLEKSISFFKANPQLLMGPRDGHLSSVELQGSGARRTLLWNAIRLIAERPKQTASSNQRPNVLLLDEPELCLHPAAVRDACNMLYGLPERTDNWQVMVTTHSPCFVDFSRRHTSIVRVENTAQNGVTGTTIFRPDAVDFDEDDKGWLKLLNMCDPYVAEFFFGGQTVLVEGDTEYTAFKYVASVLPDKYGGIHIVRARGKATLVSLCKILNQFGAPYSVLHDSDTPENNAWRHNDSIKSVMSRAKCRTRLLASVPNFEGAYLKKSVANDKPYNALRELRDDVEAFEKVRQLLESLINFDERVPLGACEWETEESLRHELQRLSKPGDAF